MRPRGVPRGSSALLRRVPITLQPRFNEAAGRTPRKPPAPSRIVARSARASMRPRGVPRGSPPNLRHGQGDPGGSRRRRLGRFNEAAGRTPRKRTARKSLCVNGLPWQLRAVSRRRVATAGAAMTPGVFLDHNYLVIKDLPALRALPGVAAAPQRSIRERRAAHQSYDERFPPHGPFGTPFFQADDVRFDAIGAAEGSTRTT